MSSFFTKGRGSSPPARDHDDVSMPLREMRSSEEAPLNGARKEFEDEDNLDDFDPLLASAEGTLERVKAEIEYELGSAGADSAYESTYACFSDPIPSSSISFRPKWSKTCKYVLLSCRTRLISLCTSIILTFCSRTQS